MNLMIANPAGTETPLASAVDRFPVIAGECRASDRFCRKSKNQKAFGLHNAVAPPSRRLVSQVGRDSELIVDVRYSSVTAMHIGMRMSLEAAIALR